MLPDDGDCIETCWSCFNVNFNILFKAIWLCFSWWMGNFDDIGMYSRTVKIVSITVFSKLMFLKFFLILTLLKVVKHLVNM